MTDQDFLINLKEILQYNAELYMDSVLPELEEWDSVTFMVVIAFFDKHFGKRLTFSDLQKVYTPADLLALRQ